MGWASKLGWLVIIILIILALMYFLDKPMFCNIFASVMNPNISSKICGAPKISSGQKAFVTNETNAIERSSPVPIKKVAVFGSGSNTTTPICQSEWYNFSVQKSSYLYVYSNGFYVPSYEVVQENYYKANSTSLGDYIPSLIGQKVYLSFYVYEEKTNVSAPYIVKSETIQGNQVIWNMTFDGNMNNTVNPNNVTQLYHRVSWLNGIIISNGTTLISPQNPYIKVNGKIFIPNTC